MFSIHYYYFVFCNEKNNNNNNIKQSELTTSRYTERFWIENLYTCAIALNYFKRQ